MSVCEPENYTVVATTVEGRAREGYRLHVHHRHEGAKGYCPNSELYDELSWNELEDLLIAVVNQRRPGMHPAGWEQDRLF